MCDELPWSPEVGPTDFGRHDIVPLDADSFGKRIDRVVLQLILLTLVSTLESTHGAVPLDLYVSCAVTHQLLIPETQCHDGDTQIFPRSVLGCCDLVLACMYNYIRGDGRLDAVCHQRQFPLCSMSNTQKCVYWPKLNVLNTKKCRY